MQRPDDRSRKPHEWPILSIKQPWAQLILEGRKDVEVRDWKTDYRGPLWIHTGQKLDSLANRRFDLKDLFRGGIVGLVVLFGIHPFSSKTWEVWRSRHLDEADFDEELAKYGWIFRDPQSLKQPLPAKGSTGLFRLHQNLMDQLEFL